MKSKISYKLLAVVIVVAVSIISMLGGVGRTYAAVGLTDEAPSGVLEDLQKDTTFNASAYPQIAKDYSMQIIQIAESTEGELFVYVYQPSGEALDLRASSINIAREMDNSVGLGFKNYSLTYVNSSGVFYKYRVEGFQLQTDAIRYYNISNILRLFNFMIDTSLSGGQQVSEVPNPVGQFWTACTVNDTVTYSMTYSEVITIKDKYVGFVRYSDGVKVDMSITGVTISGSNTLRNFVAFSTDIKIDRLVRAELSFSLQEYSFDQCANPFCSYHTLQSCYNYKNGEVIQQDPIELSISKQATSGNHKYVWDEIQSTADFIAGIKDTEYKITTEGVNGLDNTKWVLSFYNAVFSGSGSVAFWDNHLHWTGENVSDVIILRLTFERDGVIYNLGVVDNKQTGSSVPINEKNSDSLSWILILLVVAVIVAIIIIFIIIHSVFTTVNITVKEGKKSAIGKNKKRKIKKNGQKEKSKDKDRAGKRGGR